MVIYPMDQVTKIYAFKQISHYIVSQGYLVNYAE